MALIFDPLIAETMLSERKFNELFQYATIGTEQGNAAAKYYLSTCFLQGLGVDANESEAIKWLKESAEQGYSDAQYELGSFYECGWSDDIEDDIYAAFHWYKLAGEQGNVMAQSTLGYFYSYGNGTEVNYEEAVKWWRLSAESGFVDSQLILAECYYEGKGVSKNESEAAKWVKIAAENRDPIAQRDYACYFFSKAFTQGDEPEAIRCLKFAADNGNAFSKYFLGQCYYYGRGVEEDKIEAARLYKEAALEGCTESYIELGICYSEGSGVEKNPEKAFELYKIAAEKGWPDAQYYLGCCYSNGQGTKEDKKQAVFWFQKAAGHMDQSAQFTLGRMYYENDYLPKDDEKAWELFEKAAERNHGLAAVYLAFFYEKGIAVEQSTEKYHYWYKNACNRHLTVDEVDNLLDQLHQKTVFSDPYLMKKREDEYKRTIEELQKKLSENENIEKMFNQLLAGQQGMFHSINRIDHITTRTNGTVSSIKEDTAIIKESLTSLISEIEKGKIGLNNVLQGLNTSSAEIERQISDAFQKMTITINERIIRDSNSDHVTSQQEWLKALFGQNWNKLDEYTRKSLISALTFLNQVHGDDLDYSGVVIAATSALENELKRYFFDGYQSYLSRVYGTPEDSDTKSWPRCMLYPKNESAKKFVPDEVFTIGSLPYIFGKKGNQNPEDADRLNEYLQTILVNPLVAKGIESFNEKRFIERCEQVRNDYRNKAAHTEIIKRESAQECCDKIIGSKNVGEIVSILYDLMQMIK